MERKHLVFIIAVVVIIVLLAFTLTDREKAALSEEQMCIEAGGEWALSGCGNTCEVQRGEFDGCADIDLERCVCGEGLCWDGESCVAV